MSLGLRSLNNLLELGVCGETGVGSQLLRGGLCRTIAQIMCDWSRSMSYLHCARCGLRVKIQAAFLSIQNCPRCLARTATVTPLVLSPVAGWGSRNRVTTDRLTR